MNVFNASLRTSNRKFFNEVKRLSNKRVLHKSFNYGIPILRYKKHIDSYRYNLGKKKYAFQTKNNSVFKRKIKVLH